jgi:hypothetical protein
LFDIFCNFRFRFVFGLIEWEKHELKGWWDWVGESIFECWIIQWE